MCDLVLHFLNNGGMSSGLNETHVVLIPKIKKPKEMKDLRPISLCNISYKLISKVLANRLKKILPDIIDKNQSVFVPSRLISDNVLLDSEVFHFMKTSLARKRGFMALKLDMSKAYNRVEWDYLQGVMLAMGFPRSWVTRVMEYVTSISYSFLVNGHLTSALAPQRGIRQGDPLCPYLFLICAEGLGSLIKQAYRKRMLREIQVARGAPIITHLFFADDSMIFTHASIHEVNTIGQILWEYEALSGQKVNLEKCEVSFSRKPEMGIRLPIIRSLGFMEVKMHGKYLGLPTVFDKSKRISFAAIRDCWPI